MFAIVQTGGKQYKVQPGDHIEIERLEASEGDTVILDKVLLVGEKTETHVGTPLLDYKVEAKVVDNFRGEKIRVFKMKAKKRYQKTQGHRQEITKLEITGIKAVK
ncbi:50S ribosomal protein L21 [Candidatus Peregrinibacteria bacterium HGW-Peregrinibacteria-1]|jgi:large subunit ribosomal protein L21|nr:MAG: 50S ribosomal protein L21 [Candidatus Peregrinibacteria bacterium HGW-Peregrinibacteria-1]